ncbi:MAG: ribosome small subunit-dependent GTPase A [Acidobacteria bacterium]|nr:ribosome small subunit-dependent GTPase A [Acidobacteriota bacterium]
MGSNKPKGKEMKRLEKRIDKWRLEKEEYKLMKDRRTPLVRKLSRNINQILILSSITDPEFNPGLVDRFLLLASIENMEPVLCISKADLGEEEEIKKWKELYETVGVPVIVISSRTGIGVEKIRKKLSGKRTALAGHSGVGKSTLLNAISPDLQIDTGPVNLFTGKGKHVTKSVKLFRLDEDTDVFDLPGIKLIDFPDLSQSEVAALFPDFNAHAPYCKFKDCTHTKEPECAVVEAVEEGEILKARYESYIKIIAELSE